MSYLDERMQRSETAFRCRMCRQLIQLRFTPDKQPVVLEPYASNDGAYVITAELHAVRSDGPHRYAKHRCTGDE